jgi:hypothetical protein
MKDICERFHLMKKVHHQVEFCVVGGGMAGLCAAVAAARHGVKTALVHDRPVLGGNASSEIRMHVCGAHGKNNRETGLLEEIELTNINRNACHSYSIWDSVLYEKAIGEPNLLLLLNSTCREVKKDREVIRSINAWQLTTETEITVEADLFADCSGDGILGAMAGAEFRVGREARAEFNEDIEPETADQKTMGMSCLIQVRETTKPQVFVPPSWARVFKTDADLPCRGHDFRGTNFWWIELGGENDSIHDTEILRDELLEIAFGVWDHVKNQGDHGAANWVLEWVGFLPGKRESRRFAGDHILTQNDVRAEGRFDDLVGYGGWSMDDHHPAGLRYPGKPTIFHPAPSPYGIPYRCLYSKNVSNLFFAGRNISATHAAMSSTRVMSTCAVLGQAVGTAASIAVRRKALPREVYLKYISELKQMLMEDDAYLPWNKREMPELTKSALLRASEGDPEPLRNGIDRPVGDNDNGWTCAPGGWLEYSFEKKTIVSRIRMVFDSNLDRRERNMPSAYPLNLKNKQIPETMVRAFHVEAEMDRGRWVTIYSTSANFQRLVRLPVSVDALGIRVVLDATWGSENVHMFAFDVG